MKRLILVMIFIFTITTLYCQTYFSIYAGANYSMLKSHINNVYMNEINPKVSFSCGTSLQFTLYKNLELLTDLDYSIYSSTVNSIFYTYSTVDIYKYNLNLGYLSISVLPQVSFGKNRVFFFNVGPYLSVLTNSKRDGNHIYTNGYPNNTGEGYEKLSGSANSYFNRIDFGIVSGIGFNIRIINSIYFVPNIKYRLGLSNIGDNYFKTYNLLIYNRDISLTLGIKFKISKDKK